MEEKEFKEKYYTSKTFKFEPPTFEDFLNTSNETTFAHWFCEDIHIVMFVENNEKGIMKTYNQFEVDIYIVKVIVNSEDLIILTTME